MSERKSVSFTGVIRASTEGSGSGSSRPQPDPQLEVPIVKIDTAEDEGQEPDAVPASPEPVMTPATPPSLGSPGSELLVPPITLAIHDGGPGRGLSDSFQPRKWPWKVSAADMVIKKVGPRTIKSPLPEGYTVFLDDAATTMLSSRFEETLYLMRKGLDVPRFQRAGPRKLVFHQPATCTIAIMTAGGLCPGLNNVIRSIVMTAKTMYGVPRVLGIRHGYYGLDRQGTAWPPMEMDLENVKGIQNMGGTILGMSRGPITAEAAVDTLLELRVNVFYAIGGDGTQKAAHLIHEEVERRGLCISIIGLPKTIDNDINFVERTFGFDSAVEQAAIVLNNISYEAEALEGGIGLVRLMGRDSGFIAAHATLAAGCVDFCLVPEMPWTLGYFLQSLKKKIRQKGNAVIAVAEGAGQDIIKEYYEGLGVDSSQKADQSGNLINLDIGLFLKDQIKKFAKEDGFKVDIKYCDPSYIIRSCKACAADAIFCQMLAQNAVHAGIAGKTDCLIGSWHGRFIHVPLPIVVMARKKIDMKGSLWSAVIQATEEPELLVGAIPHPSSTPPPPTMRHRDSVMLMLSQSYG